MKKILLIGDGNSIWIKKYIEHILLDGDFKIYVTMYNKNFEYYDFYKNHNIHVILLKYKVPLISHIPKVRWLVKLIIDKIIIFSMMLKKYDIIHVHYLSKQHVNILKSLNRTAKTIGTFCLSDLFRATEKTLYKIEKTFKYFDCIVLSTMQMQKKFREIYSDKYNDKIRSVKFGVSGFNAISSVLECQTKKDCKEYFRITKEKIVISIGYNANRAQQHLEVLEVLSAMPKETWNNIVFVLPMTYGDRPASYIEEIESKLKQMDCEYFIFEKFMSDIDIAKLRISVDIFIHSQITDAFSASIQEYLYAGAVVLNPVWIQYTELKKNNVDFIEYSSFYEIPKIIEDLLKNKIEPCITNKEKLFKISSWENVKNNWLDLYK